MVCNDMTKLLALSEGPADPNLFPFNHGSEEPESPKLYVAVDIGCIECGEESNVLGIYTDQAKAESVCDSAAVKQRENWTGEHSFEVFEVKGITE